MRFQVECYENVDAFNPNAPRFNFREPDAETAALFAVAPLRRVANLVAEVESSKEAADVAYHVGNNPFGEGDAEGVEWPRTVRSLSVGDVVLVHTPDGPVAYGCLSWGWMTLPTLPESVVAALR